MNKVNRTLHYISVCIWNFRILFNKRKQLVMRLLAMKFFIVFITLLLEFMITLFSLFLERGFFFNITDLMKCMFVDFFFVHGTKWCILYYGT